MKLMWGATQIGEVNATQIAVDSRKVLDVRLRGWATDIVYTARTFLRASGQADCKTKMDALAAALDTPNQDLKFLNDDGTDSHNSVATAATVGGTRCVGWRWAPEPRGAQFTTGRFVDITFEYRLLMTGLTNRLTDWQEVVEIDNAQPRYAENEAVNGVAAEIIETIHLPICRASQTGFAVGATGAPVYATVAPDLFVGAGIFKVKDTPRSTTPKYRGTSGTEEYRLDWRKEFISASPFVAALNPWPAGG